MGGPLSKFINKDKPVEVVTAKEPVNITASPPPTISLPAQQEQKFIRAWQYDRLTQEMDYQEQLILAAQDERKALSRQRDKIIMPLDKVAYDDIMREVAAIQKAREGRNKPPEEPLEMELE